MTFRDASGNVLSKAEMEALAPAEPVETPPRRFTQAVYETYSLSGEGDRFESGKRLKFRAGQVVSQRDFDALFKAATITSITPNTGAAAGGTEVTIVGTNLIGTDGVTFDGVAATQVAVVDDKTVTCTSPAGAVGPADVVVAAASGPVTSAGGFTYT